MDYKYRCLCFHLIHTCLLVVAADTVYMAQWQVLIFCPCIMMATIFLFCSTVIVTSFSQVTKTQVCSGHISMWPSSSWPLFLLNYLKHLQCRGEVSIIVVTGPEHIPALSIITCSRLHFPCFHMSMLSQEVSPPSDSRSVSPADGPVGKFTSLKGYQKYLVRIVWMPPMETALYLDLI